jgi:hypothetical protein
MPLVGRQITDIPLAVPDRQATKKPDPNGRTRNESRFFPRLPRETLQAFFHL